MKIEHPVFVGVTCRTQRHPKDAVHPVKLQMVQLVPSSQRIWIEEMVGNAPGFAVKQAVDHNAKSGKFYKMKSDKWGAAAMITSKRPTCKHRHQHSSHPGYQ